MTTNYFKRRGATPCSHGHVHRTPEDARMCDVAHRLVKQKQIAARPELRIGELIEGLRKIVLKGDL